MSAGTLWRATQLFVRAVSAAHAGGRGQAAGGDCTLAAVKPDYFSVTHGAGGSNQEGTYETLMAVVEHAGVRGRAAPDLRGFDAQPTWPRSWNATGKRA